MQATKFLKAPAAVAKAKLSYVLVSNLSDRPLKLKQNALVAHLVAQHPKSNLHFVEIELIEENKIKEETKTKEEIKALEDKDYINEDELLGDRIYIPTPEAKEISKEAIQQHLHDQIQHLLEDEKSILEELVFRFKSLFASNPKNPGLQTKTRMHVKFTEGTTPLKYPPYRANPKTAEEIRRAVNELLENQLITKSTSPWSFPVVVVAKPDGSYRFCVDYSKLTNKTIKDTYPLPRIDDTLDYLTG